MVLQCDCFMFDINYTLYYISSSYPDLTHFSLLYQGQTRSYVNNSSPPCTCNTLTTDFTGCALMLIINE